MRTVKLSRSLSKSFIVNGVLIAVGMCVRVYYALIGRPLWIDESALALSISARSHSQLLRPLDYDQAAPLGYLWATRSALDVFGVGDRSLRSVALLASCLTLVVLWHAGRRVLGTLGATIAVGLAIFAPTLVYYANEVKPYSSDALIAVMLLLLAQLVIACPRWDRVAALCLGGVLSVWLSAPAVFVLAGIGCVLLGSALLAKDGRRTAIGALCGILWLASFIGAYEISYARASKSAYMQDFWGRAFLSVKGIPEVVESADIVATVFWSSLIDPNSGPLFLAGLKFAFALVAIALMQQGFKFIREARSSEHAWLLVAPALVVSVSSLGGFYPIASRLLLFLVPFGLLLIAGGMMRVTRAASMRHRTFILMVIATALPLAGAGAQSRWAVRSPRWGDTQEVIQFLMRRDDQDPVYIYSRGVPSYAFYTTNWENPDLARLQRIHELVGPETRGFENAIGRGREVRDEGDSLVVAGPRGCELLGLPTGMRWRHRSGFSQTSPDLGWAANEASRIERVARPGVWLIFIHYIDNADVLLLGELENRGGKRTAELARHHTALYRYEFTHFANGGLNEVRGCASGGDSI